jgi:F0F1-type ATP synthase alpha subunit
MEIKNLEIYLGVVIKVRDGIAIIRGLDKAKAGEVLEFSTGVKGLALNLSHNEVSAVRRKPRSGIYHQFLWTVSQPIQFCD